MKWFRSGRQSNVELEFSRHQERLARLSGEMLNRYRAELDAEISDPNRLAAVYGSEFAKAGTRGQARNVATMAANMLHTPNAMVNVITTQGQQTIASFTSDPPGQPAPIDQSFCQHVIGTQRPFAVDNSKVHNLVCDTVVARNGQVISYLGVPIARSGHVVGVLCVFDDKPRHWCVADVSILTQLAAVLTRATTTRSE